MLPYGTSTPPKTLAEVPSSAEHNQQPQQNSDNVVDEFTPAAISDSGVDDFETAGRNGGNADGVAKTSRGETQSDGTEVKLTGDEGKA